MTTITKAEYDRIAAEAMTERALEANIEKALKIHGWLVYHTRDSRGSAGGFPDLTAAHPRLKRLLFAEFKREPRGTGKQEGRMRSHHHRRQVEISSDQVDWLDALAAAHREVYLITPADWVRGFVDMLVMDSRDTELAAWGEISEMLWIARAPRLAEMGFRIVSRPVPLRALRREK